MPSWPWWFMVRLPSEPFNLLWSCWLVKIGVILIGVLRIKSGNRKFMTISQLRWCSYWNIHKSCGGFPSYIEDFLHNRDGQDRPWFVCATESVHGGFHKWGIHLKWMVYFMENPNRKLMMTGGTHISGNIHI
jgi:hypothetical protein